MKPSLETAKIHRIDYRPLICQDIFEYKILNVTIEFLVLRNKSLETKSIME